MRLICSLYQNEYRNFKLAGATKGSRLWRSEEDWKSGITGAVIHICMGATQGNSPCSYHYLKLAKMPYFSYYKIVVINVSLLQN
jgi:hypothetical protein